METEEQQQQEVEALGAIYGDHEFELVNGEYPNIEVKFVLSSAMQGASEEADDFELTLLISLPKEYPDVIPEMRFEDLEEHFSESVIEGVMSKLREVAQENLGMVMIFTIISSLQEEIGSLIEHRKAEKENAVEEEKKKAEEKEQARFLGTVVNLETFKKWKDGFDMERIAHKEKLIKEREAALAGKLTGRQQFLKDATLNLSDAQLMEDVDIDESLFDDQDLDGLDLEDLEEDQ
ncbi:hypothetical protein PMAYCL1PPCAC_23836 [Pristionchus mayeri]|uniref:RWD domain-containing protein n=1 Tax=Pristionchus mayeri TaxID=1317129 RepID=A0AAN5I7Z6_9BILA|nr:hypothetical protein PMAYCL1PPCAC_23836 [Pristionchus mayeri]